MSFENRRVVTGVNHEGKSFVISDSPLAEIQGADGDPAVLWRTDDFPVDNKGAEERAEPFTVDAFNASSFLLMFTAVPGQPSAWHATDSIDYVLVMSGEVTLELETGPVQLRAGDILIDRGFVHSWRATGDKPAVMFCAVVRANPVGAGAHFGDRFDMYTDQ
jgi:quercetin dioxygenase-like cupin family protein